MNLDKVKIWVGVGAYALATSAAIATSATALEPQAAPLALSAIDSTTAEIAHSPTMNIAQAGEAGEGGAAQPSGGYSGGGEAGEAAGPAFVNKLSGAELVNGLRQGGYVIFFRHGQTEADYADQVFANPMFCSTQRVLSEQGWQQARAIGQSFRDLRIPVGDVIASQYCRAWQTADLAFGRYRREAALNFAPAEEYTDAQTAQMKSAIMPFLTAVPARGMNTVLVGHDDVFDAATGIYPEPQGVAFILKPDGRGGFEILARILASEWAQLPR
jgi:phosphohistidine phosphatase SixA